MKYEPSIIPYHIIHANTEPVNRRPTGAKSGNKQGYRVCHVFQPPCEPPCFFNNPCLYTYNIIINICGIVRNDIDIAEITLRFLVGSSATAFLAAVLAGAADVGLVGPSLLPAFVEARLPSKPLNILTCLDRQTIG